MTMIRFEQIDSLFQLLFVNSLGFRLGKDPYAISRSVLKTACCTISFFDPLLMGRCPLKIILQMKKVSKQKYFNQMYLYLITCWSDFVRCALCFLMTFVCPSVCQLVIQAVAPKGTTTSGILYWPCSVVID